MTIEEALTEIKERIHITEYVGSNYVDCVNIEALRMAIEALEQPEIIRCKDCTYQVESWIGMKYCEVNGDHIGVDYDYCSNARRKENG